ncbi:MAG TPA: CBS domain-containing protein [Devosia sp.]|jgi:CBS domain-containing protein|nr:CBS domain-containing protein [Devosia sp.]
MRVQEVMTKQITGTTPEAPILQALKLMVDHRISGLPVLDENHRVVGMLTEGDLLRRAELGTEEEGRPGWLSFLTSSGKLADNYVHTHGRKIGEIMSGGPVTVSADASLEAAVELMEKHHVKRLPVVDAAGQIVGIIARSDIVRSLYEALSRQAPAADDAQITATILAQLKSQPWIGLDSIKISVRDGVVDLDGTIFDERQRTAIKVLVENTPGVKRLTDHLVWIEPMSGLVLTPEGEEQEPGPAANMVA